MIMSKKHYKDMASRLSRIRFNNGGKTSVNRVDMHLEYENAISDFFNSFSNYYDEDIFFDAILIETMALKSTANGDRIKRHEEATEILKELTNNNK